MTQDLSLVHHTAHVRVGDAGVESIEAQTHDQRRRIQAGHLSELVQYEVHLNLVVIIGQRRHSGHSHHFMYCTF